MITYHDFFKELTEIEDRIRQYEQTSIYMKNIDEQLDQISIEGFDREISEIRSYLTNLHAHGKVKQLVKILNDRIQDYEYEYELFSKDFNQLPIDFIDREKIDEIKKLSSSPKTIHQAWKWIKNIQKYIDRKDRMCFPRELKHYTNEYLIGTGGFSRVYKVKNMKKNKIVAVKIPIKNDECIGKSFLRELNNWVQLDHKNIVKVYDFNILPVPYIEMEYCDSCLDDMEKPVQLNLALYYIHEIAEGLQYAHKSNIAHLDLKPQNVLLKNNVPKITDWGLSKLITMQGTSTIGISLPFAAPEQFSMSYGKKDTKTDIWQIGILLYYLLTNKIPFSGNDFAEYGKNVTTKNIKAMILDDSVIEDVAPILVKCLAKKKKNRYENISLFLKDVEEIM